MKKLFTMFLVFTAYTNLSSAMEYFVRLGIQPTESLETIRRAYIEQSLIAYTDNRNWHELQNAYIQAYQYVHDREFEKCMEKE
ncbi:MAG TPA: hypothetical protein VLG50_00135 [Candidatus Saccharimonadales bacterium]|nr:hypothetical protein [Candidatus Saccharimonadales bacterium]